MAKVWTYKRNWNYEVSYRDLVGNEEKTMNLKVPYDSDAIRCVASEIAGIDFDYGEYTDVMANYLQIVNGDNGNYIHYVRNTDKNYYVFYKVHRVFVDEPSIRRGVK